jgi:hypothetical protein
MSLNQFVDIKDTHGSAFLGFQPFGGCALASTPFDSQTAIYSS